MAGYPPVPIEHVREEFRKAGLKLLTREYINSKTPLWFECKNGHQHTAKWNNFYRHGQRCPLCWKDENRRERKAKAFTRVTEYLSLYREMSDLTRAAERLGLPYGKFREAVREGRLPAPSREIPGKAKKYYSNQDLARIGKQIKKKTRTITVVDL